MLCRAGGVSAGELVTGADKYKFEPGDKVLVELDFRQCPVGEPPQGFDEVVGAAECVRHGDQMYVAPASAGDLKLYKRVDLGRGDFSIEFTLVPHDSAYAWAVFELYKSSPKGWHAEKAIGALVARMSSKRYCDIFMDGVGKLASLDHCNDRPLHFAIQARRGQYRVYLDGKRLTSVPFSLGEGERVSGFGLIRVRGAAPYEALFGGIRAAKYTEKEASPLPEDLGVKVDTTARGWTLTVPARVLFDFNEFVLKPEARSALDTLAGFIEKNKVRRIIITGYTDNVGSAAYNLRLSLQRAQSVGDYLMYRHEIPAGKLTIVGKGEADPVADNGTEEGRAQNRRVTIELVR